MTSQYYKSITWHHNITNQWHHNITNQWHHEITNQILWLKKIYKGPYLFFIFQLFKLFHNSSNYFTTLQTISQHFKLFHNIKMTTPNYCSYPSLQWAKNRINNPPGQKHYEHYVGSWACTMLKHVFADPKWIITPEKRDQYSKKRPDLVVEEVISHNTGQRANYYLIMELKSTDGDRFEEGLAQVVDHIVETLEMDIEVYVVVQRGTKIGFFEYHNDRSNLDEEGISHFRGCISLTQTYPGPGSAILTTLPHNIELFYHNSERLISSTDLRTEAENYNVRCVFDLNTHENEINYLFHHMANNSPRSSVWITLLLQRANLKILKLS